MIFNWFTPRSHKLQDPTPTREYSEKPIVHFEAQHREIMSIIEEMIVKIDEMKALIDEMKNENNKNV